MKKFKVIKIFKVTFQWDDTDTYCTNICIADSAEEVYEHYSKAYKNVTVNKATDYEYKEAVRKNMPIVRL